MNTYKITWNTNDLKIKGFSVVEVVSFLKNNKFQVIENDGARVIGSTVRSIDEIKNDLSRYFTVHFKITIYNASNN